MEATALAPVVLQRDGLGKAHLHIREQRTGGQPSDEIRHIQIVGGDAGDDYTHALFAGCGDLPIGRRGGSLAVYLMMDIHRGILNAGERRVSRQQAAQFGQDRVYGQAAA